MRKKEFVLATVMLMILVAGMRPASASHCVEVVVQATVCVTAGGETECTTEFYTDDYWCTGSSGEGSTGGGGTGGGGTSSPSNPADSDNNDIIDHWKGVIQTEDACSDNFDANDRLGTNFGGTNSDRPDHTGVDIQADLGDPVSAIRDGEIGFVGWQNPSAHGVGCGYHIRILHTNGDTSVYCHLVENSETFAEGDGVRAGTVIGSADSTGNSTGHHVHVNYNSSASGQREEYFDFTDTPPTSEETDPDGC